MDSYRPINNHVTTLEGLVNTAIAVESNVLLDRIFGFRLLRILPSVSKRKGGLMNGVDHCIRAKQILNSFSGQNHLRQKPKMIF